MSDRPPIPTDRVRLHVALYKMTRALGLPHPDFTRPDHELLEAIADAVNPALAAAWQAARDVGSRRVNYRNPYVKNE